jgi:hypothetical protein
MHTELKGGGEGTAKPQDGGIVGMYSRVSSETEKTAAINSM